MEIMRFMIPYLDTEDIQDEDLIKLHRKYWAFIAANELKYKPMIVNSRGDNPNIMHDCFLCEYAHRQIKREKIPFKFCSYCPSKKKETTNGCLDGLYKEWCESDDDLIEKALEIAMVEMEETL